MGPNTLILCKQELSRGLRNSVGLTQDFSLVIEDGLTHGSYHSEVLAGLPKFVDVVASWNSSTPRDTFVELSIKVKAGDSWSQWFSYGKWSDNGGNIGSIKDQKDDIALLDTDLLRVHQGYADAIQFKLVLSRQNPGLPSPSIRLVGFSWTPFEQLNDHYISENVKLEVAPRAQLPVPEIGNIICSPTSLATVMAYHGYVEATEKVAAGARDNGAKIYGNWSYNVAYAGEKGFTAWVERCNSLEDVKKYLNQGLPVIASIRIKAKEELEGALSAYPAGHLLVITGLAHRDGQDYVLVNDPAAHKDEDVPREYRYDQFTRAWTRKRIYVLKK